ncbi:hypothetical protein CN495_08485 [Bacillus thuringiensis]|uniref:Uncharacterized protein n=1 Tax=Bacillus thuringiensis TaxID=1428 RepID=A0ABD6S7H0_BACTU|nr:hypothetical protein [Bacillus thuringiensis]PER55779.1 hypothetical protein CN495_08485 [Bacillus thuringiensis]
MVKDVKKLLEKTHECFPKSFVNKSNELIFEPESMLYFRLDGVKTAIDFRCKVLAWLSRPISKELSKQKSREVLLRVNRLLGAKFTQEDMEKIYMYLGNDVNRSLCVTFIESNYDMTMLGNVS